MQSADRPFNPHLATTLAGVGLWLALLGLSSEAAGHDGAIQWRTLRSDVAEVHYPAHLAPFARRLLLAFGDAHATLTPLFDYKPPLPMQLVVEDYADDSNGFANPMPYDRLLIRAAPPGPTDDLADNGDWLRALIFHEYSHLLHLGSVGGVPELLNTVLGRTWLPNNLLPRFFVEGLATHFETRHVGRDGAVADNGMGQGAGGRVEGARYMGRLRAAIGEGTFPAPRQLTGPPLKWPRAGGWYLYGSWLLDYQVRRFGHARLRRFVNAYGARLVPFAINNLYREIYGMDAVAMWHAGLAELRGRVAAEARLRAHAVVPPVAAKAVLMAADLALSPASSTLPPPPYRLTRDGQGRGRLRMHPDGRHVLYARAPADDLARIERLDVNSGQITILHRCELDCDDVIVSPDGKWLLWIATRPYRRLYRHKDIFARRLGPDAAHGPVLRLTRGLRGRELSISPDGRRLWVVTIGGGLSAIASLPFAAALARAQAGQSPPAARIVIQGRRVAEVLSSPAEGPGRTLWFGRGAGRTRQLWSATLGPSAQPLAPPTPVAEQAAYGVAEARPDGRSLGRARVRWVDDLQVFQRDGQDWLGAVIGLGSFRDAAELALPVTPTGATTAPAWRLRSWTPTGVYSAAFGGAGQVAAATMVHGGGLDVHRLGRAPKTTPSSVAMAPTQGPERAPYGPSPVSAQANSYSALPSLRPRGWSPLLEVQATDVEIDPAQVLAGGSIAGVDAARTLGWQLFARSDLAWNRPTVVVSLDLQRWEPRWTGVFAWADGFSYATRGFRLLALQNRRFSGRLGGKWALPFARDALSFDAGLRLSHTGLVDDEELWRKRAGVADPFGPEPSEPNQGATLQASAGVAWNRSERYPDSIEIERQRRLALYISYAEQGSQADRHLLRLDLHGDFSWPLGGRFVLQWRARAGWALDHPEGDPAFRLAGLTPWSAETLLFGGAGSDFGVVRGVVGPISGGPIVAGRGMLWTSAALHIPLADLGTGLELLPVFFGRARLSLFYDAAAFNADLDYARRHATASPGAASSTGGELRVDLETAYMAQGSLRLGFARVFGDIDSSQWYIRLGY